MDENLKKVLLNKKQSGWLETNDEKLLKSY